MLSAACRAMVVGAAQVAAPLVAQDVAQDVAGDLQGTRITRIAGLTWLHVHAPRADKVGVVLAWPVGAEHDPAGRSGMAQAVRALLELCQRDLPARERLAAQTQGRSTLLWTTVPIPDLAERLGFLGRLLGGRIRITGDLHALAVARARLWADDKTRLYPGPALYNRARRCLYPEDPRGRPVDGEPAEIARITRAELGSRYREHYGRRGAVLATVGGVAAGELEKRLREILQAATGASRPPVPVRPAAAEPVARSGTHPRLLGPYVSLAIPAPGPGDLGAAFVVGVGAMRHQAQAFFGRFRGGEVHASFPFVRYEFLAGDPLVMINRRGRDDGSAEDVRREIRGLVGSIAGGPGLGAQYLEMSRREVVNTLQRPWQGGPREVVFRARVLCLRKLLGIDDAFVKQVEGIGADSARAALLRFLGDGRRCWLELLQDPSVRVGGLRAKGR